MFCEDCGNKLPDDTKFCGGCGAKSEFDSPAYEELVQPTSGPTQTSPVYTSQQSYTQPIHTDAPPLRVGQYIGMLLLMCVPILNIILLFVWSFGGAAEPLWEL